MPKKNTMAKKRAINEFIWGWGFILPAIIGLGILNIYPIIGSIYQSFFKMGDFGRGNVYVGLQNYQKLIADKDVWQSVANTFLYAVIEVPISIALALVIASLLNRKMIGRTVYRMIFFLPMVAAPAAIAMVWRWIFNSEFGLINNFFGIRVNWISNPRIAIFSIAAIGIWSIVGYNMVLFLSGLQEIPRDYYEAAAIDGATGVRQFFNITLPLVSPTLFFVCVTRVIAAMQVFDLIYMVVERNNPALYRTQSLVYLFYRYTFVEKNVGYGSAIVVLMLGIIMIMTGLQMLAQKKWVYYQ